jgi:hypothetical protein
MLVFPQLSTGALAQFPILKRRMTRTVLNEAPDGARVKLADAAAAAVEWELAFATLSDAERGAISELHAAAEGRLGAFTFLDPTDNLLCWSEKLDETSWASNVLLTLTPGISDPLGGSNATRVSNTGAGPLGIQQIVNGPAWFAYALSVWARSDSGAQLTLSRSTETQTQSASLETGVEWKRLVLSGSFGGVEEALTFGVEIGAGQAVELFGVQAEAQPGASGYKKTLSACGVYPAARFMSDELAFTADGPDQHSCRIGIRARL